MPSYIISKWFSFEAGHHLPHLEEGHPCRRPHGHSYKVELALQGSELDERGFVADYRELDQFKHWIDENLDHRDLNQVAEVPTTAENLARWFYGVAVEMFERPGVHVYSVTVKETEKTEAEYIT
jgi:6-pyruvoyltetrahydropterin/6-carboxytetrahydropterin synthase